MRTLALLVLGVGLLAGSGCEPGRRYRPGTGEPWPFEPTNLRIHPLTRFVAATDAGPPTLETHVELRDRDGFDARGVGMLRLSLRAEGRDAPPPLTWSLDLDDLVANRRHFDHVTQTYVVPLAIDWPAQAPGSSMTLTVDLERPSEPPLRSTIRMQWPAGV